MLSKGALSYVGMSFSFLQYNMHMCGWQPVLTSLEILARYLLKSAAAAVAVVQPAWSYLMAHEMISSPYVGHPTDNMRSFP